MKDADLSEYGCGFYPGFLTAYPKKLSSEKNAPWNYITRLTKNNPNGNMRMGYRVLTIWKGDWYKYCRRICN